MSHDSFAQPDPLRVRQLEDEIEYYRCQLAEALGAGEERLRTIVEEMPVLIDAFDFGGRVVLWNRECARVTGYEAVEVLGRTDTLELLYPDPAYRARMLAHWKEHRADYRDQEWALVRKDGAKRIIAWSNIADRVPIPGWASWAIGVDVTRRRRAEEALRPSEERYQTLVQIMPHGVCEIDPEGRILVANVAFHRIHGYEPGELIGRTIYDTFAGPATPEQLAERMIHLVRDQPPPDFYVCQDRTRDGRIIDVEATWDYRRDADGNVIGFVAVVTDVTDRKRAEAEQQRIDERLRETQKLESLGVLAGGIAHDFNNLLMSILGNSELARYHTTTGSPMLPHLEQIERASLRAADLCQQMLAYAGRKQFQASAVDLGAMIHETAELLRLSISKKVTLRLEGTTDLPAVRGDATQLRQVVLNLILNASEAIGDRPGRILVRLLVVRAERGLLDATLFGDSLPEGRDVCLEVRDSGCGMSEEVRVRIFEPFYTTKTAGRGLGLSAVIGIVRGHRGTMSIETGPERGTTFRLYLPATDTPAAPVVGRESAAWTGQGTVLVADDEAGMRQVARGLLETLGFTVVTVEDGQAAVEQFRQHPRRYRFVLLDLTMPVLDGRQALAELRETRPDVPAILMSGYSESDACDAGLPGPIAFLQKPFRRDELAASVRRLLENEETAP